MLGGAPGVSAFSQYTYGFDLSIEKGIENIVTLGSRLLGKGNSTIFLTTSGNLYGFGEANRLGLGDGTSTLLNTQKLNEISNIEQIAAGKDFFIAIDSEGKVFGTGGNRYGILGRWKGVDRGTSNSRYKTALNWVECPELEI